jgi:hypothetical protein
MNFRVAIIVMVLLVSSPLQRVLLAGGSTAGYNPLKNAYFGDLHVHTSNCHNSQEE